YLHQRRDREDGGHPLDHRHRRGGGDREPVEHHGQPGGDQRPGGDGVPVAGDGGHRGQRHRDGPGRLRQHHPNLHRHRPHYQQRSQGRAARPSPRPQPPPHLFLHLENRPHPTHHH